MAVNGSTCRFLQRVLTSGYGIPTQLNRHLFWTPTSFFKRRNCFSTGHSSILLSTVASHILEQEEIINSFIKDPEEYNALSEFPKYKRNNKYKTNSQSLLETKDNQDFVAVKKNPRSQYKRGRVAKLVMRCAGEVLCGETNFGHLIFLEQVKVSEDLLQAIITWNARSTLASDSLIDYVVLHP
ncbi:uncharacterized protein Gasu_02690 [Galdieria sulphuraria]|uniref:Uncharacterized protein n=1 Tax=Galdieria sulphuraria TaxID=130081 RepID=M2Y9F1_GALSU|nr:uncharacterized protein Gasu_02690 [Galdieria sulphuraria]EME32494.1 hypothetical protein Gasu_02690 [Galdieria sulphuraria]|eukprot:XP_005709014.1 hypothetical protein Gasu_02690 [Galdieria sulphuraria]